MHYSNNIFPRGVGWNWKYKKRGIELVQLTLTSYYRKQEGLGYGPSHASLIKHKMKEFWYLGG